MQQEQKDMVSSFVTIFKDLLTPHLKPDVSIKTSIYPMENKALVVMHLNHNNQSSTIFKQLSNSEEEAMRLAGVGLDFLPDTNEDHRIGVSPTEIVNLASFAQNNWTEKRASCVVDEIIRLVKSHIKKDKHQPSNIASYESQV